MNPEIRSMLTADGVVAARRWPHLVRALNSCCHRGEITRVLPGVYALPESAEDLETRLRAVRAYGDEIVVTQRWAASRTWWPEIELPDHIQIAGPRDIKDHPGFEYEQRYIRPDLVTRKGQLQVTAPALTVLDLIPDLGSQVVDEALRRRATTLAAIERALKLTPGRRGNKDRRAVLDDSRDQPWSPLERDAHRRLRTAGITGWVTNHPVRVRGASYYLDIALPELKIAIEVDGAEHHGGHESFHADRRRDQDLAMAGWRVARFTAQTMDRLVPVVMELIRQAAA